MNRGLSQRKDKRIMPAKIHYFKGNQMQNGMEVCEAPEGHGGGFVKIHRRILDWEWYREHKTCFLFIHLLLQANHKERHWRGVVVQRGQIVTSRKALSVATGLSEMEIRTSLGRLQHSGEIDLKSTNKYTTITICNYDKYQDTATNQQPTNNQQTTNKQPTNNHKQECKEGKECKEVILLGRFVPPSLTEVAAYCAERKNSVDAQKFVDYYSSTGWMRGKNKIKDWKACVRTWEQNSKQTEQPSKPSPFSSTDPDLARRIKETVAARYDFS